VGKCYPCVLARLGKALSVISRLLLVIAGDSPNREAAIRDAEKFKTATERAMREGEI